MANALPWRAHMPAVCRLQVSLSRGVQHSNLLVQHLSLECLGLMLSNVEPLFGALEASAAAAAAAAASAPDGDAAAAGTAPALLHRRLRAVVRARLPDLQTLVALHASLERACAATSTGSSGTGAVPATTTSVPSAAGAPAPAAAAAAAAAKSRGVDADLDARMGEAGAGGGADANDGTEEEEEQEDERGAEDLEAAVFAGVGPRARPRQAMLRLLGVLAAYCRLLPESVADAHFDAVKLLPQVGWARGQGCRAGGGLVWGVEPAPWPAQGGQGFRVWNLDHPHPCFDPFKLLPQVGPKGWPPAFCCLRGRLVASRAAVATQGCVKNLLSSRCLPAAWHRRFSSPGHPVSQPGHAAGPSARPGSSCA